DDHRLSGARGDHGARGPRLGGAADPGAAALAPARRAGRRAPRLVRGAGRARGRRLGGLRGQRHRAGAGGRDGGAVARAPAGRAPLAAGGRRPCAAGRPPRTGGLSGRSAQLFSASTAAWTTSEVYSSGVTGVVREAGRAGSPLPRWEAMITACSGENSPWTGASRSRAASASRSVPAR